MQLLLTASFILAATMSGNARAEIPSAHEERLRKAGVAMRRVSIDQNGHYTVDLSSYQRSRLHDLSPARASDREVAPLFQ